MSRVGKLGLLGLVMALSAAPLLALDANDIKNMLQNGVQESVIISMLQNQKLSRPLTTQEVIDLNQYGASATLLEQLTHSASVDTSSSYTTTYSSPSTTTTITPAPTIVQSPPTVVTTSPQVIYTEPSTVYYTEPYRYYRPSPGISFYFGSGRRHWGGGPPRWGHGGPGFRPRPPHGRPPGGRPGGPGGRPPGGRPGGGGRPPRR